MALKKLVNGVVVDMTPDEEAAFLSEHAANAVPSVAVYTNAVQSYLDTKAREKHYDNIVSACSYAGAPNPFQAEGQAFIVWRGDVWASCYRIMADVNSSLRPAPTIPELIAELPELEL